MSLPHYVHGIYVFTELLTGRGYSLEEVERMIITQVLNIIQKVSETAIHLKVDEERWKATQRSK